MIKAFLLGGDYPELSFQVKGSGSSGAEIGSALQEFGGAIGNVDFGGITLKSYRPSTPSTKSTAPRNTGSKKSGGKKSSPKSGSSDKEAQEAEKERKERVQEYKDNISEIERLDERYVKQQQEYGKYTDNDVLFALAERSKRYRAYAEEVLNIEYMTEEEKLQLHQEYTEKAEDLELQYYQDAQQRDEDFINDRYDKRLTESEEWVDYQKALNAITVDDEIAAGRRIIEAAQQTYDDVMNDTRLSVDFRTQMLEKLDGVIADYGKKEITLNRDKWDKIISDMQDSTDKIISMYDKMDQASDKWISEQKGRDMLPLGKEIEAYDRRIDRWDEELAAGKEEFEKTIAEMERQREEKLASGNYTESSPEIEELDKQIEAEKEKLQDYYDEMNWQLGELENTRYQLYKDFLQQQVQDFVEAEREKVNAHYDALREMEDQEDRDKKRRELQEQIKQYEGAAIKEGKEKLKDLLDQLEELDKEEKRLADEKQREEELDALGKLEEGLLEQAEMKAQLVFDNDQVAREIKNLIDTSDGLAKEFANCFTQPFEDYFTLELPQQIRDAFEMPDIARLDSLLKQVGKYETSSVSDHRDYSRNATYNVTVNTHSGADLTAITKVGG